MRVLLALTVWMSSACAPPAKANRCAWSGDFAGSTGCLISQVSTSAETTMLELLSDPTQGQPLIRVTLHLGGEPRPGHFVLEQKPTASDFVELGGCDVWFFGQVIPGDGTRDSATYAGDPSSTCSLKLEEVELLSEVDAVRTFTVHGTLQTRIAGGHSVITPGIKHADLFAGF